MSGFSVDWLSLREPADAAARAAGPLERLRGWAGDRALRVMDLGAGTGSTRRALAEHLPEGEWVLVDADAGLLAEAKRRHPEITPLIADLTADPLPDAGADLVTASAFFDLVSQDWLDRFTAALIARRLPLYAALSYDGVMRWQPEHGLDAGVTALFNHHQQSDKGFGAALGPAATGALVSALSAAGYEIITADSPWRITGGDLHDELVRGIAAAVLETHGMPPEQVADWLQYREDHTEAAWIGHTDLLALPPGA